MNKYEIIRRIEEFAPPELAESWDCSGWLIETDKQNVRKIMLCLTVTDDVVKQAKNQNCDMIISHHPLFEINCHSELVSESLKPLIDIYCAHTNLDRTRGGTTDILIDTLGLSDCVIAEAAEPMHYDCEERSCKAIRPFVRYANCNIEINKFISKLRTISPNLRYVNNYDVSELKKIAFCAGSGAEFIKEACENGADALVTGDIKFHTALESPIVLFDIGHFESEILILSVFEKLLDGVETVLANEYSPFKY